MATATSETRRIREATFGTAPLKVDGEAHVIRGVKCLGRESKNGRVYTDQALADAARLYDGIGVNLDHRESEDPAGCRRMVDGFGVLREPRIESDGVFADLHYLESHPLSAVIVERAQRFPGNFGLSHDATGAVSEDGKGGLVVEGLQAVESVDIVQRPATNAGLFESERSQPVAQQTKPKHTVRSILEANAKDKHAASLLLLLEEEEFAAAGEMPVESEASTKDAIKAALRRLVMKAFDDDSLDAKATLARMAKIIKSQEDMTRKLADGTEGDAGNEPAVPAMESITRKLEAMEKREGLRDLLESRGLQRSDLTAPQLKIFDRAASVETAGELLESWDVRPLSESANRPAIGPARGSTDPGSQSYADLKEATRPKPRKQPAA